MKKEYLSNDLIGSKQFILQPVMSYNTTHNDSNENICNNNDDENNSNDNNIKMLLLLLLSIPIIMITIIKIAILWQGLTKDEIDAMRKQMEEEIRAQLEANSEMMNRNKNWEAGHAQLV
jgi:hypothetical protein